MIQMNWELALAGDMRYNPTTQMLEVYDGNSWTETISSNTGSAWNEISKKQVDEDYVKKDVRVWIDETLKKKALDELFGVK